MFKAVFGLEDLAGKVPVIMEEENGTQTYAMVQSTVENSKAR